MRKSLLCAAIFGSLCQNVIARPADYVFLPMVEYGEREIDFKLGSARSDGRNPASAASIGFGYGATSWWFTELYAKYLQNNSKSTKLDAFEWENKFQLTDAGTYPVDLGFILELERPQNLNEGYELKFGPLAQTDFGRIQVNANLLFMRVYQASAPNPLTIGYQMQLKYRYRPEFEFGLQGFGEMGKWDSWNPHEMQSHRLGPAIFGKLRLHGRQAIRYNTAYLLGTSHAAPYRTFRMQLEYEF